MDDGSRVPPEPAAATPFEVKVVRQEHHGFGLARGHNTGVRAAAHDILLFLDGDMLPETGWIAAHARWHQAASGLLTVGFRAHVSEVGVGAAAIRERVGTLRELFADRPADPSFVEGHMVRTRELTSRDDDIFRVVVSANFGIRRELYDAAGGFDESFTRWGAEDTEFGYRVYTLGGVLVPARTAFAWHQGRRAEGWEHKQRMLRVQRLKIAHLIAHEDFRDARPGRGFTVPQYVVTVEVADLPAERIVETTERLLADRADDLIVRTALPEGDPRLEWVAEDFGGDPRVTRRPAAVGPRRVPVRRVSRHCSRRGRVRAGSGPPAALRAGTGGNCPGYSRGRHGGLHRPRLGAASGSPDAKDCARLRGRRHGPGEDAADHKREPVSRHPSGGFAATSEPQPPLEESPQEDAAHPARRAMPVTSSGGSLARSSGGRPASARCVTCVPVVCGEKRGGLSPRSGPTPRTGPGCRSAPRSPPSAPAPGRCSEKRGAWPIGWATAMSTWC